MRFSTPYWGTGLLCASLVALGSISANAATIAVPAGGDLQAALNAAQPGDTITLQPGATYAGNFVLPNKGAITSFITIRSAAPDALLPPANVRVTPAYAAQLPKIKSSNNMSALRTAAAANHYKLMFLEFQANVGAYGDIVELGAGDASQTQLAQVPYALVVDRVYVHGDPVLGQKRGIALHSSDTTIVNSYIADIKAVGQEAQAISGFNGPGNYDIENNYLEGSTQCFLMGGADPMIPNLVTTNITFRGNYLSRPLAWKDNIIATPVNVTAAAAAGAGSLAAGTYSYKVAARVPAGQTTKANSAPTAEVSATVSAAGSGVTISWTPVAGAADYVVYGRTSGAESIYWTTTNPYFTDTGASGSSGTPPSATKWYVKNIFELKNAQDVLVEGNVMENLWVAAQPGFPIVFTPRNQGGTAPWVVVQRVTFQHNLVRHTAGGVNILGTDNVAPSQRTNHITVRDNIFDDMSAATWGSGSRPFQLGDGPDAVAIDHNTVITTNTSIVWLYGGSATSPTAITNTVYTNNMSMHNSYGIDGSNFSPGMSSINAYMPGAIIGANVLAGGSASKYPTGNYFPTTAAWQSNFVDYAGGDYRLGASSAYKNAATDGTDLGANPVTINGFAANAISGDNRMAPGTNNIQITTNTLPDGVVNTTYTQTLGCTGGSGRCAWQIVSASLPAGVVFDTVAGAITGTPTAIQTGNVTVTAYDPAWPSNSATKTLTLTIDPPPFVVTMPAAPQAQVNMPYQLSPTVSGAIGTASWTVSSGSLPGGMNLDANSGAISGAPTAWGTSTAVVQATDSWSVGRSDAQPLTITVAPAPLAITTSTLVHAVYQQPYAAVLSGSGGTGSATWSIVGGALPAGVTMDSTGVVQGTPTAVGTFTITVQAADANWPSNVATGTVTLVVDAPAFSIAFGSIPQGTVNATYQLTPSASGNVSAVAWSLASGVLPTGLSLDGNTGSIAGTPTQWGTFNVTVRGVDTFDATRSDAKSIAVVVAPTALQIATTSLTGGIYNAAYSAPLTATGGTGSVTWTIAGAPTGVSVTGGAIAGTPLAIGSFFVTLQATDANWPSNIATTTLPLVVNAPSFSATLAPAPNGRVGLAYATAGGTTQGAVGMVTWSGSAPAGLIVNASNGAIVGTPSTFGSFTVVLQARDSYDSSRVASAAVTIAIAPLPIAVATSTLADGSVRAPYQSTLVANGGTGLTSWSVTAGSLPAGLTLSPAGVISGTPTAVGTSTFTVQAVDAGWAGNAATQSLTIAVHAREVLMYASDATKVAGTWSLVSDTTAAGGTRIWNPDKGAAKINTPLANPANYFEVTFQAEAGVAYHFWLRGKADANYWGNDSVMIQFDNAIDANGAPMYRTGTTAGGDVNLEDCSGCGESGWGWQDNGWGANVFGPNVYFAQSGAQTLRVQVKEDGFSIDQIVLSADKYKTVSPGALKNDATILPR